MRRNVIIMTVLAAALGLAACNGGKDAASGSNYISEAEQQVALEQHPLFGEVPSLQKRQAKALDLLDDALDAERDAVRVKADNDNYEEVTAKVKDVGRPLLAGFLHHIECKGFEDSVITVLVRCRKSCLGYRFTT